MLDTSARLLRLLSLLQARREWRGPDLAERLGVTPRTVRRDVDRLRSLGYPVHATPGIAGGYRLGAGSALPPLLLDDDEAVAVAVGLRTAAGGTVDGIEETSARALAKLEQVLPARLRHRVQAFQATLLPLTGPGPTVDPATLTLIAAACRDRERLRFDYRTHDGATGVRDVEPHRLLHTGRRWYLLGYDVERGDWRTFRVDRMSPRTPAGPRFAPRDPPAPEVAARGVASGAYPHRARLLLRAPAEVVAERVSPAAGTLVPLDADTCLLHTGAHSLDLIVLHLGLLGVEFEVQDPPELADRLRAVGERLLRAAEASRGTPR